MFSNSQLRRENAELRSRAARLAALEEYNQAQGLAERERQRDFDRAVPRGIQIAAAWSWRVIAIAALLYCIGWICATLSSVTIPLAIGLLLTAGLSPIASRFRKWGMPRVVAALITLIGGLFILSSALTLIVAIIANQSEDLANQAISGWHQLLGWLSEGPLHIGGEQLNNYFSQAVDYLREQQSQLATYAVNAGGAIGNFLTGTVLALVAMFFMLYDGRRMWEFFLALTPKHARERMDVGGRSAWRSLVEYVRATVIVAAVDAVGPLVAAMVMGVPAAPALGAMLFLSAFVPIVGLLVSGFIVTLITLVTLGWVQALVMLGTIIVVNQLEGNLLQPLLMGKAVSLHPMAVMFGITVGIAVGGIVGALLVVPVMAAIRAFVVGVKNGRVPDGKSEEQQDTGQLTELPES